MISFKQLDPFFKIRRAALVKTLKSNHTGIDFIRVQPISTGIRDLEVHFIEKQEDEAGDIIKKITPANIRITPMGDAGGTPLQVESVTYPKNGGTVLTLHVKEPGGSDKSNGNNHTHGYFLEILNVPGIDVLLSGASLILGDLSLTDPRPFPPLDARPGPVTEIDYLCKDYAGFRRLILDHLSLLAPQWQERHIPDPGITLVELMAYVGDYLSYYQDAAASEAYPGTARRRISLRRHVRLLDYFMHQGCTSRVLVQVRVNNPTALDKGTPLLTTIPGQSWRISPQFYKKTIRDGNSNTRVFETMHNSKLFPAHNRMNVYGWAPPGHILQNETVTAELEGHLRDLKAGDLLIFETANPENAGQPQYHPVRLTRTPMLTRDPPTGQEITCITWSPEDALPDFMLTGAGSGGQPRDISALGNIVLADYGRAVPGETLPMVTQNRPYYPRLNVNNLVFSTPYHQKHGNFKHIPHQFLSARHRLDQDPADALPAVELIEYSQEPGSEEPKAEPMRSNQWAARRDLLDSGPFDQHFVVETEEDGGIYLRFGDGKLGKKPVPATWFKAFFRTGNGPDGGVEPRTITHIVTDNLYITGVFNPQAATPYTWPESIAQVRRDAPRAFKTQERCITSQDYEDMARRHPEVTKARAQSAWTGSWHTTFIYVDRKDGKSIDPAFKNEMLAFMEPFRPAGFDLEIRPPYFVPLHIVLTVYTGAGVPWPPLLEELDRVFSNDRYPDGTCGFFHPDNFTFGQPLYLSTILARAMQVTGVNRVDTDEFRRMGAPPDQITRPGCIAVGPLEIVRLDNNPAAPQNGTITFSIKYTVNENT
jgi:hypothetical protein